MDSYILDWANLLLRWLHVITAIAWVGSSFYFVFLDSSLTPPVDEDLKQQGVSGELWAVHGGGFYHPVKFAVSPPRLPDHLHWFYWESYSTWLSGFALLSVSYLWNAKIYLVDPSSPNPLSSGQAIAAALGFLALFWLCYDAICRWLGARKMGDGWVAALVAVLVVFAAWLACQIFPGQAAFLLMGAMLATAMSANVFFWIIPGQRTVVKALREGQPVDPIHGQRGKQRSVHNTYFTLPVLFAMLSNHYGWLHAHAYNWLVLVAMMFAGALIRQFFVLRHGFKLGRNRHPWPYALIGLLLLLATAVWLRSEPPKAVPVAAHIIAPVGKVVMQGAAPDAEPPAVPAPAVPAPASAGSFAQIQGLIGQHCLMCHSANTMAQKNVRLDSPEEIQSHARQIYQQVVQLRKMPFGNPAGLSDAERAAFGQWFESGAALP